MRRDYIPQTKLKQIRLDHNMTLQQVADKVGITKPFLSLIEHGKRGLKYELAARLSDVFGMRPDQIFLHEELTNEEQTVG